MITATKVQLGVMWTPGVTFILSSFSFYFPLMNFRLLAYGKAMHLIVLLLNRTVWWYWRLEPLVPPPQTDERLGSFGSGRPSAVYCGERRRVTTATLTGATQTQ